MDKKVLDRLQALCSRKEYSSGEMLQKALKLLDGDETGANEILNSLVKDGYVCDARYASAFARDKAHISGWGPVKIAYSLRSKGIAKTDIDAALKDIDADVAGVKMLKVLETKAKALRGDPQSRLKLIRFALSRGYEYDSVSKFLAELEVGE